MVDCQVNTSPGLCLGRYKAAHLLVIVQPKQQPQFATPCLATETIIFKITPILVFYGVLSLRPYFVSPARALFGRDGTASAQERSF